MKIFIAKYFLRKSKPSNLPLDISYPKVFESYNQNRKDSVKSTFCQAPSINLYFSWEGKVIACCFNQDFILGYYPEQSIEEIWRGEKIKELRESLKNYDLTKGCASCQFDLKNSQYKTANSNRFDEYPICDYPQMIEFQLGNTCNLACVMCNGHLSSTIRKNREGLPPLPMKYDEKFVDELIPYIPHLKFTNFSGGEPFLIDIYYSIWEKIISLNPKCIIKITTNGNVLNHKVKNILENGNFDLTVSLDSIHPEKYENIRIGANFNRVMDHIQYFSSYCARKGTRLNLNFCPMYNNWEEIPDYLAFCKSINATVYFSIVYLPLNLSIQSLSLPDLYLVIQKTEERLKENEITDQQNLFEWRRLKNQIQQWIKEKELKPDEHITKEGLLNFIQYKMKLLREKSNVLDDKDAQHILDIMCAKIQNEIINSTLLYSVIKNYTLQDFIEFFTSENIRRKDVFKQFENV